jgi:hypothetical protein
MKRNRSRSGARSLADELAELRRLNPSALKQRWRVLYRTEAPVHIGRALLLQAVAYRLQERVLGGLKPSTRRLLERAAEDSLHRRTPSEAPIEEVRHFCRFLVFAVWPSEVSRKAYAIAEQPSKGMLVAI